MPLNATFKWTALVSYEILLQGQDGNFCVPSLWQYTSISHITFVLHICTLWTFQNSIRKIIWNLSVNALSQLHWQFHLLRLSQICCQWNAPILCLSQLKTQLKTFTILGRPSLLAFDPGKAVINVSQNWVTGHISQPGLAGKTSFDVVYFILWQHFTHSLQWTNYMAW